MQLDRILCAAERNIDKDGDGSGNGVGRGDVFERCVDPALKELRFGFVELCARFIWHVFSFGYNLRAWHRRTRVDEIAAEKCGGDCGSIFSIAAINTSNQSFMRSVRYKPCHHYSTILLNILTIYAIVPVDIV